MQESISNSGVVAPDFHERLSTHGKRLEGLQGLLKRRRRQWRGIKGSGHGRKSVRMIRGERDLGLTGLPVNGLVGCRSGDGSGKVIERVPRGMRRGFGATGPCLLVLRAVGLRRNGQGAIGPRCQADGRFGGCRGTCADVLRCCQEQCFRG